MNVSFVLAFIFLFQKLNVELLLNKHCVFVGMTFNHW